MDINKIIDIVRTLKEEGVTNSIGGGAIAGTAPAGDDPPGPSGSTVRNKKKYIYQKGLRKMWLQNG